MAELTRARALRLVIEAERRGAPFIVAECERDITAVMALAGAELLIGRSPECDVVLEDARVSRLHARLERVPGGWVVGDEGLACNGVWVNGRRLIGRCRLADRDIVLLGRTTVTFRAPTVGTGASSTVVERPLLAGIRMTPAQRRVLIELSRPCRGGLVVAPASNQEIAGRLFLSVVTVKSHLKALFEQFDVGELPNHAKRARLVELVLALGLLSEADFVERT